MRRNGIQPAGGGRRGLHWDGSWVIVDAACADVDCLAKLAATRNPQPHGAACRDAQPVTAWPSLPRRAARNRLAKLAATRSPQPCAKQERAAQPATVRETGPGSQPTLQLRLASKEGRRFSRSSYALQNDALDASLFTFAGIAQGDARIYHECKAGKQGRIF